MKKLFFVIVLLLAPLAVQGAEYCKIGGDPFDLAFQDTYMGPVVLLPAGTMVRMKGAKRSYTCELKGPEPAAADIEGNPHTLLACGNPLLAVFSPQREERGGGDISTLLALANRPMGMIQPVDGGNAKSRARAAQVGFHFGAQAGYMRYDGLKADNYNLSNSSNNTLNQEQNVKQKTNVRQWQKQKGDDDGNGGGGGGGGPGGWPN